MDAHGIQVFHVADGYGRVVAVTHDLIFDLFEALDAFFDQHLPDRGQLQRVFHQRHEALGIVGKAAAGAAQGEGGPEHNGIADPLRGRQTFADGGRGLRGQGGFAQRFAKLLELLPVLRLFDGPAAGAQQFHAAFLQDAFLFQTDRKVQPGLAADAGKDGVRPLAADDLGHIL